MTTTQLKVYLDAQKACGLHVGDWVRVTRKAENCECGWASMWSIRMNQTINSIGKIEAITANGIRVVFDESRNNVWNYPYFVLEKVDMPECAFKPFDRVLVRDKAGEAWRPDIFSMYYANMRFPYRCISYCYAYCISYEGNEHLAGTTEAPE